MKKSLIAGILLASLTGGCQIQEKPSQTSRTSQDVRGVVFQSVQIGGVERKYAVYVPRGYRPDQQWPLVVFLNGSGECGTDGQRQLTQGLIPAALADGQAWPFVIVCPQKPDSQTQWIDHDELVMATLSAAKAQWNVDPSRIYLTGLSQGGAGTWAIGARHPEIFAALAPICGYGLPSPELGKALFSMPIWAFHGAKDDIVPPSKTETLIESVKAAGGKPIYTLFPEANHNSWDAAYRTQKLGDWFLQHRAK